MSLYNRRRIGQALVARGLITEEQLQGALEQQKETGEMLDQVLVGRGFLGEEEMAAAAGEELGVPYLDLQELQVDPEAAGLIPWEMARRYQALPVQGEGKYLTLAMANPLDVDALAAIKLKTGREVRPVITGSTALGRLIEQFSGIKESMEKAVKFLPREEGPEEPIDPARLRELVEEPPIVKVVNTIVSEAYNQGASDIHLDPHEEGLQIRFRIDGILHDHMLTPRQTKPIIISRLKIMSNLDISQRRLPQDGRFSFTVGERTINLRIATMPVIFGEKIVLRLLDREKIVVPVEELGFNPHNYRHYREFIRSYSGMVLVTGPTGCGKTTTLYSTLNHLNTREKNIIALEDPVEYYLEGISQVQINSRIGLTFAYCLRSVLRQDPNIMMIGEIRDLETAEIAIRAALTGHLVFSTLHTADAPRAVIRMLDMGTDRYLLASSITGVIAQRLVRKVCPSCREKYSPTPEEREVYLRFSREKELPGFYRGRGCQECNQAGYRGRAAIHEVMPFTRGLKDLVIKDPSLEQVARQAREDGLITLQEEGMDRVSRGITTIAEVIRVTM